MFQLEGGTPGVIWRGLAYPVLDGNRIDIAGPAVVPGATLTAHGERPTRGRFAVVAGVDAAYLLIQGSVLDCEHAAARLGAAGVRVIRTGRYLGDSVDGLLADWFIRVEIGPATAEPLEALVGTLMADVLAPASDQGSTTALRLRLIESELASAKAKEAGLRTEIARLKLELAERHASGHLDEARARKEIDALQQALVEEAEKRAAAEALALEAAPRSRPIPSGRVRDEIIAVFESLLPRVRLLRNSLDIAAVEFSDRRFLYTALAELAGRSDGMPTNWKKLKGLDGWLERHISNGLDDAGRIYARLSRDDRAWDVLVSFKSEQARDITWLRTRT